MTMLDRMRQHKGWLKWSLAAAGFALLILGFPLIQPEAELTGGMTDVLAQVGDEEITVGEFRNIYLQQLQSYQTQSGGEITSEILQSMGIDRQLLQQMIDEYAALAEAERLGFTVTDAEIRERILSLPAFQQNGQFVGEEAYLQLLRVQQPPTDAAQFEENVRRSLTLERLQAAVTNWITISDDDLQQEYVNRNEQVRVSAISFRADDFREGLEANDEDVAALYEQNATAYLVPEKRRLRFVLIDVPALKASFTPSDLDIQSYYDNNLDRYTEPTTLRASHILLRNSDDDAAAVQARAEAIVAEARAGADFAALAQEHSEDVATKDLGGDLGEIAPGQLTPEVENAAFALEQGEISDPVTSLIGVHVIMATEKTGGVSQSLAEVRASIVDLLKQESADARARALADAMALEITTAADLDTAASRRGLEPQESAFAAPGEPILGLGFSSEVTAQAFQLAEGQVAGPIQTPTGPAFVTVTGIQDPYVPPLEEIETRLRDDVIRRKAFVAAQARAAEVVTLLEPTADDEFEPAAQEAGLDVNTSDLLTRGTAIPGVGLNAAVEAAAFALPVGETSAPILTGNTAVVLRVLERQEASDEGFETARETLRGQLISERQNQFFSAYMEKAKTKLLIDINMAAFAQAVV
ncbi:MAG: peptidyl-prolyl cis-trans isomerase [Acidobacteriota bacterium]|nr:peptidyl-prolyl cis-trans isomerase [Acidobacteriota bacterium]